MTKSKARTVKPAPKKGQGSKDKLIRSVASSSAIDNGKSVKEIEAKLKSKKPTLKEQVASLQYQYDEQCEDYQNLINECSYKDMEIANLKQKVLSLEKGCADYAKAFNDETEITIWQQHLINELRDQLTPWHTKLINFLKGY